MRIVDTHVHFWNPAALDYFWLKPSEPEALRRAFMPDELEPQRVEAGVTHGVYVQVGHDPRENDWILNATRPYPWIRGIVGWPRSLDLAGIGGLRQRIGICRVRLRSRIGIGRVLGVGRRSVLRRRLAVVGRGRGRRVLICRWLALLALRRLRGRRIAAVRCGRGRFRVVIRLEAAALLPWRAACRHRGRRRRWIRLRADLLLGGRGIEQGGKRLGVCLLRRWHGGWPLL